MRPVLPALLCVPLAAACTLLQAPEEPSSPLPSGWDTLPPYAFEELIAREFGGEREVRFGGQAYRTLRESLDRMDETSVRAALLLAHSRHEKSGERLLRRLLARAEGPEVGSDAGDVTAAAALARLPRAEELYLEKLVVLARGARPHPDLEVRVECAVSALALGDDSVIPFLLQVLRIGTFAGQTDERDFAVSERTAWARGRAASALSRRAGVPDTYQPDGSIADREREAARLAGLLVPAHAPEGG
jgi:hypothetical protein